MYDREKMAEAWRTFVNGDVIDEKVVRPEVARSWRRCKAAGLSPWSSDFPATDEKLLKEKRAAYAHSLAANQPVMKMLLALCQCNVSLMDQENFVFEFYSPLSYYPRTFGTHLREEEVGTGNATCVAVEKKPVRFDGFEHYRTVAQSYSGVSVPFLDAEGRYFGALNMNSPFGSLPDFALEMCEVGVSLADSFFMMGQSMWSRLRTLDPFAPLVELSDDPVLICDTHGKVLMANDAMRPYVPGLDSYGYGEQDVAAYLGKHTSSFYLMNEPFDETHPLTVNFQEGPRKPAHQLLCDHRNTVQFPNGLRFIVMVFQAPRAQGEGEGGAAVAGDAGAQCAAQAPAALKADDAADYVGASDAWQRVDRVVSRIAPIDVNALIMGETGTGKELVARAIHRRSGRKGNFIAINCGAIPHDLFAAELFGYEAGAFTGARENGALGKIEAANHGTLLLDEIGEMPLDLQVGLLRVIQEQAVTRLGATEARPLDVRILAATNQNVREMIGMRRFRSDLYYRLSAIEIYLPPLRERGGDALLLADYFNRQVSASLNLPYSPFSPVACEAFTRYSWPGNVRELRNVVERSLIIAGEGAKVTEDDLPPHVANARTNGLAPSYAAPTSTPVPGVPTAGLTEAELDDRALIASLLLENDGNMSKTAHAMGVSRTTLYKRMQKYRLKVHVSVDVDGVPFNPES